MSLTSHVVASKSCWCVSCICLSLRDIIAPTLSYPLPDFRMQEHLLHTVPMHSFLQMLRMKILLNAPWDFAKRSLPLPCSLLLTSCLSPWSNSVTHLNEWTCCNRSKVADITSHSNICGIIAVRFLQLLFGMKGLIGENSCECGWLTCLWDALRPPSWITFLTYFHINGLSLFITVLWHYWMFGTRGTAVFGKTSHKERISLLQGFTSWLKYVSGACSPPLCWISNL